jgi:hypothetical protein
VTSASASAKPHIAPGTAPTEFYFASGAGATIGGGATVDDTAPTVSVSSNLSQITASADDSTWTLDLAAPSGQQLAPGTYTGAVGAPGNGTAPGISISGDGAACDNYYDSFTIYEISATSVNATFSQTCESTKAPPLVGFIRYNATVPTPVPTLPAPLAASLRASAGAATANGLTTVTLDASATTGADTGTTYSFDFGDGDAPLVSTSPIVSRPELEGTYYVDVTVKTSTGDTSTAAPQWLTVGDGYHAVAPTRILDTRNGTGATGPVKSGGSVTLQLPSLVTDSGHGPLRAVVLNVTETQPTASGYVRVYPSGLSQAPTTSRATTRPDRTPRTRDTSRSPRSGSWTPATAPARSTVG